MLLSLSLSLIIMVGHPGALQLREVHRLPRLAEVDVTTHNTDNNNNNSNNKHNFTIINSNMNSNLNMNINSNANSDIIVVYT